MFCSQTKISIGLNQVAHNVANTEISKANIVENDEPVRDLVKRGEISYYFETSAMRFDLRCLIMIAEVYCCKTCFKFISESAISALVSELISILTPR